MKKIKNKRFLLFGYSDYCQNGGMSDIISQHDTEKEAMEAYNNLEFKQDYHEILDCKKQVSFDPSESE